MKRKYDQGFIFLIPAVIIGIIALVGGTVAAAQISLPDSPLYSIKTTTEKARLGIAYNNETRAKTHLSIANEKVKEIRGLLMENAPVNLIEKTESDFTNHESQARKYIGNMNKDSDSFELAESLDQVGVQNQIALNMVLNKIPEAAQVGIRNALERSQHSATKNENGTTVEFRGNASSSESRNNASATSTNNPGRSNLNKTQ